MINFLFLGIIPGTDIQITFEMWLTTASAFAGTWLISYLLLWLIRRPAQTMRLVTSAHIASLLSTRSRQQA